MLKQISEVIIGGPGNREDGPKYDPADIAALFDQPGCASVQQVNIQCEVAGVFESMTAVVGANNDGIMLGLAHGAALPCPPDCPGKGKYLSFDEILNGRS